MRWPARRAAPCCSTSAPRRPGKGAAGPPSLGHPVPGAGLRRSRACRSSASTSSPSPTTCSASGTCRAISTCRARRRWPRTLQGAAARAGRRARRGGDRRDVPRGRGVARRPQRRGRSCASRSPSGSRRRQRARASRGGRGRRACSSCCRGRATAADVVRERGAPAPAALGRRARRGAGRQGSPLGRPRGAHDRRGASRGIRSRCSSLRRPAPAARRPAQAAAAALRRLGETLRAAGQPAVLSAPLPAETTATAAPARTRSPRRCGPAASRSRRWPRPGDAPPGAPAPRRASRQADGGRQGQRGDAGARLLARDAGSAPRVHAPRLLVRGAATHRRRRARLRPTRAAASATARLRTWGYQATSVTATGWTPTLPGRGVYYRAGMRRAALALAGDLGLRRGRRGRRTRRRPRRSR